MVFDKKQLCYMYMPIVNYGKQFKVFRVLWFKGRQFGFGQIKGFIQNAWVVSCQVTFMRNV